MFEVKVKTADGTMDKRHLDRSPEQHGELDDEACSFLDETIGRRRLRTRGLDRWSRA